MNKKIAILTIAIIGLIFAWNGGGTTQSNSGDYWAFTTGDQPPQAPIPVTFTPVPDPQTADIYDAYTHRDDYGSVKLDPLTGLPLAFALPDSFWFYGRWYLQGANLYIFPDGFAAFEVDQQAYPSGDLTSPTKPNAVFAPYWTDLLADGSGDQKRMWLAWQPAALGSGGNLIIQWYDVEDASGNTFDFSLSLVLGGQDLIIDEGCGIIFSRHYIDFSYRVGDWGAEDPNATVGIESWDDDPHYYVIVPHEESGEDIIDQDTVIRFYYRKIFNYDLMAYDIIAPDGIVLRYTKYQPIVTVANLGTEVVNSYNVTVTITEIGGDQVYQQSFSRTQLYYYNNPSGEDYIDTIECTPVWDKPGEIGTQYDIKVEVTGYAQDQCEANNVFHDTAKVWCDADYTLEWSFRRYPTYTFYYWRNYKVQGTAYKLPGGAAIVMGGRAVIYYTTGDGKDWHMEVWHHGDPVGCSSNWSGVTEREFSIYVDGKPENPQLWPAWTDVNFEHGDFQWQNVDGKWVSGYPALGEFGVMAWTNDNPTDAGVIDVDPVYPQDDQNISCLGLDDYSYYKQNNFSDNWTAFNGAYGWYPGATFMLEMKTHLALRYPPAPPAYYEKAHDLTVYKVTSPEYDAVSNSCWVVAGEAITPKSWIGNIGREKEETSSTFPIEAFFRAVPDLDDFDTYETNAVIEELGWVGDSADDPDAVEMAFSDWTPEGNCDYVDASLKYEMQYIVKRNKVGPDKTDHCPYNDTMKITATSLWKNDAWMKEAHVYKDEMDGEEVESGEAVPDGTKLYFKCVIANTGSEAEPHDIGGSTARFIAKLEILKDADGSSVYGPSTMTVGDINWRGNQSGEPWEKTIEFPGFWEVPDQETYDIKFTVELDNDLCSKNNSKDIYIGGVAIADIPEHFDLYKISSPTTSALVRYAVPVKTNVDIKVLDVSGRVVNTLVAGIEEPGYKTITWNGTDNRGRKVGSGVYYVKMIAGDYSSVQKVVIMK